MQIRPLPWTLRRVIVLLPALCCISCSKSGPPLNPVHGKLLYKNQPLAGAVLVFHPPEVNVKTIYPTGATEDDGTFWVRTGDQEGAPAGDYVVTVTCPQEVPIKKKTISMGEKPESVDLFRGAYANKAASTLRFEIKKGDNELAPINLN